MNHHLNYLFWIILNIWTRFFESYAFKLQTYLESNDFPELLLYPIATVHMLIYPWRDHLSVRDVACKLLQSLIDRRGAAQCLIFFYKGSARICSRNSYTDIRCVYNRRTFNLRKIITFWKLCVNYNNFIVISNFIIYITIFSYHH